LVLATGYHTPGGECNHQPLFLQKKDLFDRCFVLDGATCTPAAAKAYSPKKNF
jgi:hypothetical protein